MRRLINVYSCVIDPDRPTEDEPIIEDMVDDHFDQILKNDDERRDAKVHFSTCARPDGSVVASVLVEWFIDP